MFISIVIPHVLFPFYNTVSTETHISQSQLWKGFFQITIVLQELEVWGSHESRSGQKSSVLCGSPSLCNLMLLKA